MTKHPPTDTRCTATKYLNGVAHRCTKLVCHDGQHLARNAAGMKMLWSRDVNHDLAAERIKSKRDLSDE